MKFSIITVTKNNKAGLLRAIECVRSQTYKNVEHIIVDGGSTDGTVEAIKNEQLKIKNLFIISEPDDGIYDAINKGIKLATGDVIGLLHSDDLYADENVLERYASVFNQPTTDNQQQTIEAVYSDLVYIKKKQEVRSETLGVRDQTSKTTSNQLLTTNYYIIRYWKTHKTVSNNQSTIESRYTYHKSLVTDNLLRSGWMPPHPTLFIRREVFNKYGLYNTDLKIASDYEMILRLLFKYKITSYYLPVTTYLMSIGGTSNKSVKNILQKSKEDYFAMKMNGISFPLLTLVNKNLKKLPQFLARDLS